MAKRIVDEEMRFNIVVNGNEAQKELFDLERSTRKLTEQNKAYREEQAKLVRQGKKNSEEYKRLSAAIKENNATISSNKSQMKTLQDQIGITGLSMAQLRKKASQLRLALNNMVPGSAEYKRYQADLQAVNNRLDQLRNKSKTAKTSLGSIADGFNRFAALGATVIAAGTGIVLTMQKMIDYNGKLADAQSNVRKTTGLTAEEVDNLTKSFGALKTRTARIELLGLAEEAGRLGIEGVNNIKDFVEVANQMKVALGDDLGDEQIREVGKMVKIYKVGERTGRDFKNSLLSMGSAINEVSASGANQAGFLVDFVKRTAGISDVANIAAEDMIGLAAAFDEAGQSQEISATAINKFFGSAAENVADFAKVAGVSIEEYSRLLREDANEALILFLKGLKQGNPSLEEMAMRLDGIELGGTRGAQAITALSANIENLEEKQRIANKSLLEATSLTDEYNLKNNNLAGTLDKVKKRLLGAFSSEAVVGSLSVMVSWFGRLIGAIEDVNEAFAEETKASYESVKANRQLINESQALLDEYQTLTRDGIEPTAEEKERLEIITLQLKDRLGESVMAIDAETGAYILNTEAVKQQIKIKRLAADEEAATLVSRRRGVQDAIKDQEDQLSIAEKEYNLRKKIFEDKNADDIAAINSARDLNAMEKQAMLERLDGYKELDKARLKTGQINQQIYEDNKKLADLNAKLKDLNYTEADADAFFAENPAAPTPTSSSAGGSFTPTPTKTKSKGDPVKEARKRAEELLQLMREAEDRKLDIMEDGFNKQMLLEDFNHYRKIEDLQNKLVSQEQIAKTKDANLKASYIANNEAVNSQIESENQLHQIRKAAILEKGYADDIKISQQAYEREKVIRETAFLEELNSIKTLSEAKDKLKETLSAKELAQLKTLDDAKKVLQDQFNAKELEEQKKHLDKLVAQLTEFMESGQFEGFDMSLLSPEQQIEFQAQVDALKLKIQELIAEKNKLSGKPAEGEGEIDLGVAGEMDVLGFSADQWLQTFSNLETLGDKIGAASMAVQGFMNAWSMYHEMVSANERKELNNFIKSNDKKKERLKSRLDQGYINQRQYDDAIKALDAEADKRKAEMEYKQAKRAWQMQLTQAIANTAMAVLNGLQSTPFLPVGIAMGALAGVLGGIQIATIAKNKPVKGYEQGYYNVTREQDGKNFNAQFGGESRSGLVDKPTVFLAGEGGKNFPEMIIDGNSYKQMSPMVKEALNYEIARIKGFQNGYYQNETQQPEFNTTNNTSATDIMLVEALNRNSEILEKLEANGVTAFMDKEMRNIKKLRDEFQRLEKIENKRKTN
ncbi:MULTISPECIES: phage tail tape measure protein [Flavobacteriaceae]|uniref:phage tail tape measure protein n=1 Tax=Flavobacteriaceae TaxID=49546 RepID=UPI003A8EA86C